MRSNWTPRLTELCRRSDSPLQLILEALVVTRSDVRQRKSQWNAADSTAGLTLRDDGLVELGSGTTVLASNATDNGSEAPGDFRNAGPVAMLAEVALGGVEPADILLTTVTAFLDPAFGGAKNVDRWELHVWQVENLVNDPTVLPQQGGGGESRPLEIADPVQVTAGGAAADVTFDYTTKPGGSPKIKQAGVLGQVDGLPHVLFEIRGLKADGTPATNIGWRRDTTKASVTSGGNVLRGVSFTPTTDPNLDHQGRYSRSDLAMTPRMAISVTSGLSADEIAFTGGGNQIDLGGTPTGNVEFGGRGYAPSGSALTFAVQADDATWLAYVDGQTTDDLTRLNPTHAITKRQTYKVRATLTPNAANNVSPLLQEIAVREVTPVRLDHLTKDPDIQWSVDPIGLKSNVARANFDVLADGVRDYRSAIEDLLSTRLVGTFDLRLWVGCLLGIDGHTEVVDAEKVNDAAQVLLPRSEWMLVDVFLVEDVEAIDGGFRVIGVSPLSIAKGRLPKYDTGTNKVQSLAYTAQTLAFVWDDLLVGQLGLAGRFYGPIIQDTDQVTKTIQNSDVKRELDAIAAAGRGVAVATQGRIGFKRLLDDPGVTTQGKAVVGIVPFDEVRWGTVSPGFRQRQPETFVRFGLDVTTGNYAGEYRAFDAVSLVKLRPATIDAQPQVSDDICSWLPADGVLAQKIAKAINRTFAYGMIQVVFDLEYPHPEWEVGDLVAVQVDRFAVVDPNSDFAIRGMNWAMPVLIAQLDPWGRRWVGLLRSYGDILSATAAGTRLGLGEVAPRVQTIVATYDANGNITAVITGNEGSLSARIAANVGSAPSAATVRAATLRVLDANGQFQTGTLVTAVGTDLVYVAAFAYEKADGTGAESELFVFTYSHGPLRYYDGSGKFKRDLDWADSKYAFGSNDSAGKEVVTDMYILAAYDLKVGSAASPANKAKTIRYTASMFIPGFDGGHWILAPNTNPPILQPNSTNLVESWGCSLVLPRGITMTSVKAYLKRANAGDRAEVKFWRDGTAVATLTQSAGVTGVVSAGISQLIGTENFTLELFLKDAAGGIDAWAVYVEFDYDWPIYAIGI